MIFKDFTIKFLCISFLIFFPLFGNSQKTLIEKNVNYRAKELVHYIDASEDHLILECERKIFTVEIFNEEFRITEKPEQNNASILLHDIPLGKYTVLVRLSDKAIVIPMLRNESYKKIEPLEVETLENDVAKNTTIKKPSPRKNNTIGNKRNAKSFWMVKCNTGKIGFVKSKKFATKVEVDKAIERNLLEQKTKYGKYKILTVWEVYDNEAFIKLRLKNNKLNRTDAPEIFNSVPYYNTKTANQVILM